MQEIRESKYWRNTWYEKNESIKKKSANKATFGHFGEWLRKSVLRNFHLRWREYLWHWICIKTRNRAQYLWTWCQSVVPNDVPRDFGPVIAFGAKFQIPVARQWGREMSALRPFVTDPFHPLGSIRSNESFPYICQSVPVTTSKWYVKVCLGKMCISQLRMRSHRNT